MLASRKAARRLTRGETVAIVMRDYVKRHDPQEKKPGKRRLEDTTSPTCRTVPAEVERACRSAYGDRCWVPGCTNDIFLELMHREPKSEGGSQEADNIALGCSRHHVLYDAGDMWIIGENERGLPIFETKDGWVLHPDYPARPLRKAKPEAESDGEPNREREPGSDHVAEPLATWNGVGTSHGASLTGRHAPPWQVSRTHRQARERAPPRTAPP